MSASASKAEASIPFTTLKVTQYHFYHTTSLPRFKEKEHRLHPSMWRLSKALLRRTHKCEILLWLSLWLSLENLPQIHPVIVVYSLSCVWHFVISWTVSCQGPLSMEFPGQEYQSGLPFLSLGDLPDPGIKSASPALAVDSLPLSHPGSPAIFFLFPPSLSPDCLDVAS